MTDSRRVVAVRDGSERKTMEETMFTETMSGQRCNRRHAGFTLIEILVVVAIIALLIAILIPCLQQARRQARTVVCGTNLHTIGQAVYFYTQAHRDHYPGAGSWPELVGPYVHRESKRKVERLDREPGANSFTARVDTYLCQGDRQYISSGMVFKKGPDGALVRAMYALSYGMTVYVSYPLYDRTAAREGATFSAYATDPQMSTGSDGLTRVFNNLNKTNDIKRPGDIVAVTDAGQDDLYATRYADLAWDFDIGKDPPGCVSDPGLLEVHHEKGNNFLYADQHVEFKKILKGTFMEGVPVFPRHWVPLDGFRGVPPR
jgi:prepilin-type N-terminal cleavage/methylation domain-containing protein